MWDKVRVRRTKKSGGEGGRVGGGEQRVEVRGKIQKGT